MIFNQSGGTSLNFKVIGSTTEPANPKENMIWVNTDQKISGWNFSPIQPENMTEGEVWFSVGASSAVEFNALKKNGILIRPNYAKQYVSGALVDKEAKIYQNGEWADWIAYLYNKGDEFTSITGGWILGRSSADDYYTPGTLELRASSIYCYAGVKKRAIPQTKNAVDLTNISTIYMNVLRANNVTFAVIPEGGIWKWDKLSASVYTSVGVVALDVSTLKGKFHVGALVMTDTSGYAELEFDEVRME